MTDNVISTATDGLGSVGGINTKQGCILENCLVARNSARGTIGGVYLASDDGSYPFVLVNCTIADNTSASGAAADLALYGRAYVYATNCVFSANTVGAGASSSPALSMHAYARLYLENCLISDTTGANRATSCFAGDPKFRDPANGDFRLKLQSPCIGKGVAYDFSGATDLIGNPRLFGRAVDLGCYELQQGPATVLELR